MNRTGSALLLITFAAACGDGTGPDPTPCTDDTGTVDVTVGAGLQPTFDWEPACALVFLLVEQDAGDVWLIGTDPPGAGPGDPDDVNLIAPPVTYGVTPSGVDELQAPETLVAGVTYEVILARVPPGGTADCVSAAFGVCLMAVHEFTP